MSFGLYSRQHNGEGGVKVNSGVFGFSLSQIYDSDEHLQEGGEGVSE